MMDQDAGTWKESLLLIENLTDGRLRVVPETVERLRRIVDPVRCVSFNGPYRTGKSHLLNLLISIVFNKDNCFPVGNTVQAMTKGMWIWAGRHPSPEDSSWILFMDTEGLCDVQKGDNLNDLHSFILSLLLSSAFVYNSRGTIDYQALEKLHYVSTLAEKIRLRSDSSEDEEELGHDLIFPAFIWIVRDFHLGKSVDGKALTDDEYLENALRTKHDASNAGQLSVKRCLKEYFPSRRCFTLPRLVSVEKGREGDIDPTALLSGLVDYILTLPPKIYEGNKITGKVVGRLAEAFAPAVQSIEVESQPRICVQDIMTRVNDEENSKVLAVCFEDYRASLNSGAAGVRDEVDLYHIHLDLLNRASMAYMSSAVNPIQSHFSQLTEKIDREFKELCTRKALELKASFADLWQRTRTEEIGDTTQYVVAGGYKRFQEAVQKVKTICEAEKVFQGVQGRCFLGEKLKDLEEVEGKPIMAADVAITDILKKQEEKRLEDERRLEEARVGEAAKGEAEELARKAKEFEEAALATMQRSLDERKETERAFLEERIKAMLREELALERSGLEEEVENRRDRRKKYEEMKIAKEQESLSIGAGIGATFGNFVSSALNTIMATLDPPPVVKSVFSGIRRITGI